MKKILSLILISTLLCSCKLVHQKKEKIYKTSEEFAQGSEDIPLLVGMERISEDAIGFDTNSGSIISSSYQTLLDLEKLKDFYLNTLPAMGWKLVNNQDNKIKFKRDKEKLEINFKKQDHKNIVSFFLIS